MADVFKNNNEKLTEHQRDNFEFKFTDKGDVIMTMKHIGVEDFKAWSEPEGDPFFDQKVQGVNRRDVINKSAISLDDTKSTTPVSQEKKW